MTSTNVTVTLTSGDGESSTAAGVLRTFSPLDRVRRAAVALGVGLLVAAMLIPIPLIHLLGIPLAILAGVVASVRLARSRARLAPLRLACPKCGAVNRLGAGAGLVHPDRPVMRTCDSCRRSLELRIA